MKHYTKEELELSRSGQMNLLGRINCAAHLKKCDKCQKLLEELAEDDILIDHLRESIMEYQKQ